MRPVDVIDDGPCRQYRPAPNTLGFDQRAICQCGSCWVSHDWDADGPTVEEQELILTVDRDAHRPLRDLDR